MFHTLFEMAGVEVEKVQMDMLLTDVMQTLDEDGSGEIDIDEFVQVYFCRKHYSDSLNLDPLYFIF